MTEGMNPFSTSCVFSIRAVQIAVIGYCLGGMCALDVARLNVDGVRAAVSFHGTYTPPSDHEQADKQKPIKASVLICHGDADSHITSEQVRPRG